MEFRVGRELRLWQPPVVRCDLSTASFMSIESSYDRWSAIYDTNRNRTRDLDAQVMRSRFGGSRFKRVLELGCGTGKNTGLLSEVAGSVHAFDFSEGMLSQARARVSAANVVFQRQDLSNTPWPVETASANLATFNLVLEHLESLEPLFVEVARCLVPGGLLHVSELHPFRQYEGTQARFEDAAGNEVKVAAFTHHVSEFVEAGRRAGLRLVDLKEWWHEEDSGRPPRLLTLELVK
jgi:malonyl-CoA O-methyltransferase